LWGEFLPQGGKIKIIKKQRGSNDKNLGFIKTPSAKALEDFLRSLP